MRCTFCRHCSAFQSRPKHQDAGIRLVSPWHNCFTYCSLSIKQPMTQIQDQKVMEALAKCIAECNRCAMACLDEKNTELIRCIKLCIDCAEICKITASFTARDSEYAHQLRDECEEICLNCANECELHEEMGHCKMCAKICRECASACITIPSTRSLKNGVE